MKKFILALVALIGISTGVGIANNYLMTQGSGTTFGSLLITGVNYVQMMVCDATTPTQCSAVSAAGAQSVALNGTPSLANGNGVVPTQGGSVLSASNPSFSAISQGGNTAVVGPGNSATTGGNAVTVADPNVLSALINGLGAPTDAPCTLPATGASCSDIAIAKAQANSLNSPGAISQTTQGTTNGVTNGANNTNTIAASATAQILSATSGGTTGATGDYLSHCVIQPASTSPGAVTIADNATTIFSFAGGASSVSNLVPFPIPAGAVSKSGGWKVTTGTNVSVACVGKFS